MRTKMCGVIGGLLLLALTACSTSAQTAPPRPDNGTSTRTGGAGIEGTATPGQLTGPPAGSAEPPGGDVCAPGIVAQICATVSVTGGSTVSGQGSTIAPMPPSADPGITCSQLANAADGGNIGAQLPSVGGHAITWDTALTNYRGPGEYPASDFHLTIDNDAYSVADGAQLHVAIGPDFATTITFTDLHSTDDNPRTVSGRITWTCVDRSSGTPSGM